MHIDPEKIATWLGEICAAAQHDLNSADPADVGMSGMQVVEWRKAYLEGCKDVANGIFSRIDADNQKEFQEMAKSAFNQEFSELLADALNS